MDHPNIAKVLDGGTADNGRPYFVMDLVKGVPITTFCNAHHLTLRAQLELFIRVCHAIQHAHQKGIIHRDLKPSNVVVAVYDGEPVPKVIDFGVAKAAGQPLTEKTLVTGLGSIVGTLEYMSPEQAEINQIDIDTRSDIYSLGVLLYELLTGSPPFSRKDLEAAGMLELLRVIREQEPTKPSTKLSTAEGLPTLASDRGTEPAKLKKLVRGELDWIVMKALEKDRNHRYQTAGGFANDLQRYLTNEPVQACAPSAAYRFTKFARRNRAVLVTVGLVAVALVVGAMVSVWQAVRATRPSCSPELGWSPRAALAKRPTRRRGRLGAAEALAQRELAHGYLRTARRAVDEMYTQVAEKWLATQPQMESVQREFLEKALRFYQDFARQAGDGEPAVRLETARAYRRVGDIQHRLGATSQAEIAFREAAVRLKALAEEFPTSPEYRAALAETLQKLGILLRVINRVPEEEQSHREALALLEQLTAQFPEDTRYQRDLARPVPPGDGLERARQSPRRGGSLQHRHRHPEEAGRPAGEPPRGSRVSGRESLVAGHFQK